MDEQIKQRQSIKKAIAGLGAMLLLQEGLMLVVIIQYYALLLVASALMPAPVGGDADLLSPLFNRMDQDGLPMILAVIIAFIPILGYRGRTFFKHDLAAGGSKFGVRVFCIGLLFVLGLNTVFSPLLGLTEWLLNQFGLTAAPSRDVLAGSTTLSMFLYACLIGPVFEELLYRGAVLHSLERFGKRFAVGASALLFGMMHGNIIQIPMAVVVGLVLGYLALHYSVRLTIPIHMANNLISEALTAVPGSKLAALLDGTLTVFLCLLMAIFLYRRRRRLAEYLRIARRRPSGRIWRYFFTSIPIVLLLLSNIAAVLLGIERK